MTIETDRVEQKIGLAIGCLSLNFSYPGSVEGEYVLRDLDLVFAAGDLTAVVGRSGIGKSTLLNLVALIDRPTQGEVSWDGEPTSHWGEAQRSRRRNSDVGILFQDQLLDTTLDVESNVRLAFRFQPRPPSRRQQLVAAQSILDALGIRSLARRKTTALSGGQAQRVALARALVSSPRALLIDEPTASLDSRTSASLLDLVDEIRSRTAMTVIAATHDSAVTERADVVVELETLLRQARA